MRCEVAVSREIALCGVMSHADLVFCDFRQGTVILARDITLVYHFIMTDLGISRSVMSA